MQTLETVQALAARISYKDWELRVGEMGEGFYLQWRFWERDNANPHDPTPHLQGCRKWYVSRWATDSEVVNTAFVAAELAERHEMMERFKLDGKTLRDPHASVFFVHALDVPLDTRQNQELSATP